MTFDAQELFANLAEKEKRKGHHSPEGRAIRTLSRALSGWTAANLAPRDVLVLCAQAMEDWLKARLKRSPWSADTLTALLTAAVEHKLILQSDTVRLERLHHFRADSSSLGVISRADVEAALEFCIGLIDKHW